MRLAPALAVLLLFAAGCSSKGEAGFPKNYVLEADDVPPAAKLSTPDPMLSGKNPGPLSRAAVVAVLEPLGLGGSAPDEAWVELFEHRANASGGLLMAAAYWKDADPVGAAASNLRQKMGSEDCTGANASRLYRDDHVVLLFNGDEEMGELISPIYDAVHAKARNLRPVCP